MITFKAKDKSGEIFNSALSVHTFPAGEANIKKEPQRELEETEIAILQFTPDSMAQDLMHLAMWNDFVGYSGEIKKVVVLPYVPGGRADRGQPFGLNTYVRMIARHAYAHQYIIFDPHSDVTVERFKIHTDPQPEITVLKPYHVLTGSDLADYNGVIAPDKGAVQRAKDISENNNLPLYVVDKTRDFDTGKLLGFDVSDIPTDTKGKKYLIVDDICDGGGTFLGIAEATGLPPEQLDLYVSHGVFSNKALSKLPYKFGKVITTNSFAPNKQLAGDLIDAVWDDDESTLTLSDINRKVKRIDVIRPMLDKII